MSYAAGQALQSALYLALTGDADLQALVGGAIFDAPPPDGAPETYVTLGAERVQARQDSAGAVIRHEVTIAVHSARAGFATAKQVAGRIADLLGEGPLSIAQGALVQLRFHKATASRVGSDGGRRIELIFRALVDHA